MTSIVWTDILRSSSHTPPPVTEEQAPDTDGGDAIMVPPIDPAITQFVDQQLQAMQSAILQQISLQLASLALAPTAMAPSSTPAPAHPRTQQRQAAEKPAPTPST